MLTLCILHSQNSAYSDLIYMKQKVLVFTIPVSYKGVGLLWHTCVFIRKGHGRMLIEHAQHSCLQCGVQWQLSG